jgi:hypothetical protein
MSRPISFKSSRFSAYLLWFDASRFVPTVVTSIASMPGTIAGPCRHLMPRRGSAPAWYHSSDLTTSRLLPGCWRTCFLKLLLSLIPVSLIGSAGVSLVSTSRCSLNRPTIASAVPLMLGLWPLPPVRRLRLGSISSTGAGSSRRPPLMLSRCRDLRRTRRPGSARRWLAALMTPCWWPCVAVVNAGGSTRHLTGAMGISGSGLWMRVKQAQA